MRGGIDPSYIEKNKEFLGKGIKKPRFRRPNKVTNRVLYSILLVDDMKVSQFAEAVGVMYQRANSWMFHGDVPNEENQKKIEDLLGYPKNILFYENNVEGVEIKVPIEGKFYWRVIKNQPIYNKIIPGLFALHNLPFTKTCAYLGVPLKAIQNFIHYGQPLSIETLQKLSEFFLLPNEILVAKCSLIKKEADDTQ